MDLHVDVHQERLLVEQSVQIVILFVLHAQILRQHVHLVIQVII